MLFAVCDGVIHRNITSRTERKENKYACYQLLSCFLHDERQKVTFAIYSTGDSRLVFVWPQKASGDRFTTVFTPLLRALLVGLLFVDALRLWPGEFLPTSLPSIMPIALSPIKCNVIEPQWFDNNWILFCLWLFSIVLSDFYRHNCN